LATVCAEIRRTFSEGISYQGRTEKEKKLKLIKESDRKMAVQTEIRLPGLTATPHKNPNPLLAVTTWELRRMAARRSTWVFLGAVLAFSTALTWNSRLMDNLRFDQIFPIYAHPTSGLGAIMFEGTTLVSILGLLVPFIAADQVARDYKRRTYELLMTTPLPGWAYICGRYLAGLLLGVAAALLMLAGTILMGLLLPLDLPLNQPNDLAIYAVQAYPQPNLGALALVWLFMVIPTLLLLYNLSFGLATLWPRRTGLVKALCVFGWMLSAFYWLFLGDNSDFAAWHPNYLQMAWKLQLLYQSDYDRIFAATPGNSPELRLQIARQVEEKLYDIWTWQLPHLIYILLGLALVAFLAVRYQRNRGN
jgi:ABC-type transport system involved in multi-copper enzyme maturation permease subunit